MAIDRLIGDDAQILKGTKGTLVSSGVLTASGFYLIASVGTSSSLFTGFSVGDVYTTKSATRTLLTGDTCYPLTFTTIAEAQSWDMTFTADEIEVTALIDGVKKYRKGKSDLQGNVKGLVIMSEIVKTASLMNRFLKIASVAVGATTTVAAVDTSTLYIKGVVQKDTNPGETYGYVIAQVDLFGFKLGAAIGEAQSFESGMRIMGNDPIFYSEPF